MQEDVSAVTVDLTRFALEPHVKQSFEAAWMLAEAQPLRAAHMLEAALLVQRSSPSKAFLKLAELVPLARPKEERPRNPPSIDLAAISVAQSLAASFSVAEPFIRDSHGIWGRDYVTIALLAQRDASLERLASQAGSTVDKLRSDWFAFVTAEISRRKPEVWKEWWASAGVPIQKEEAAQDTPVPFDIARLNLSEGAAAILSEAATRFGGGARSGAISTSAVLLEMAEMGRPGSDRVWIADFIRGLLADYPAYEATAAEYRSRRIQRQRAAQQQKSARSEAATLMTPGLAWCLTRAQEVATQTTGSATIRGRHLLAALIVDPPQPHQLGSARRLAQIGLDTALLRQRLYEWVRGYGDNDTAWRTVLIAQGPHPWRRAEFDADSSSGPDLLNIEQDVVALAALIAARDSAPPLSIGLFGDWGSGKTFFMRQLQRTVAQIAREARSAQVMQRELPFYKRIVQIEFNAWHYVEGNLWASLVEHILANLRVLDDQAATLTARLQEHWLEKLGFSEQVKAAADEKQKQAAAKVEKAEAAVQEAQEAHEKKKRELQTLSWRTAARDFRLSGALPVVAQALAPLGLKPVSDAVADLQSSLRQAHTVIERGSLALTPLLHAEDRKDRWRSLIMILVGTPAAAALVGIALSLLGKEAIAQISALATGAAGLLTLGAKWVRQQAQWMSQQVERIEQAQRKYDDELREALAETADKTARTEQELALARQDYLLAQQRAEQARRQEDAARADLDAATTSRLLGQFIQDRAASSDYRKHLGVLAVVRQDFQQLSQLIEEENWRLSPDGQDDARFAGGLKKISTLEEEIADAPMRINRIVLYIDDLDRCPPGKVVDVLQAVHLLLAFPLFVVVVGVDARWIARSLETRYRELLHVGDRDGQNDIEQLFGVARSEDYLEKIFQIPLWLRSMDASAARRMVQGLLRVSTDAPVQEKADPPVDARRPVAPAASPADGARSLTAAAAPPPASTGAPATPAPAAPSTSEGTQAAPPPVIPSAESLRIRDFELVAIDALSPLLGRSPRALKRFVNVYRLIKAGMTPPEHAAFVRRAENGLGDYSAVLFLLAVDSGLPRVSRTLFDALLLNGLDERGDGFDVRQLVKELDKAPSAASADLAKLKAWVNAYKSGFDAGSIRKLTYWAPRVSRYSFQAAHLENTREHSPRRGSVAKTS